MTNFDNSITELTDVYITPPELDTSESIEIDKQQLLNAINLSIVNSISNVTFTVDSKNNKLLFGSEIEVSVQLKKDKIKKLIDSEIIINPSTIIKFLESESVSVSQIHIKINKKLAFSIHYTGEFGELNYYNGHLI